MMNVTEQKTSIDRRIPKTILVLVFLVAYLTATHYLFPKKYFPDYGQTSGAHGYDSTYFTYLSKSTEPVSDKEALTKAVYVELNWIILSPWHYWYWQDQRIDCHGTFWTCPQLDHFKYFSLIFIVYFLLFKYILFVPGKKKYLALGLLVLAFGLVGFKMTKRYYYAPVQLHNQLLERLSTISKDTAFPEGASIRSSGAYEHKDTELEMSISYGRRDDVYIDYTFYSQPQNSQRLLEILNGRDYCKLSLPANKRTDLGNSFTLCEYVSGLGRSRSVSGFIDKDKKIFVMYLKGNLSIQEFNSRAKSFFNFYNSNIDIPN